MLQSSANGRCYVGSLAQPVHYPQKLRSSPQNVASFRNIFSRSQGPWKVARIDKFSSRSMWRKAPNWLRHFFFSSNSVKRTAANPGCSADPFFGAGFRVHLKSIKSTFTTRDLNPNWPQLRRSPKSWASIVQNCRGGGDLSEGRRSYRITMTWNFVLEKVIARRERVLEDVYLLQR